MIIRGYEIGAKLILYIVGGLLIVGLVLFGLNQCQQRRSAAAQARMDRSQAEAASNSAADAVGTVARSGEAAAASEALTRSNEQEIRGAQGGDVRVGAGVNAAGLQALCRREAYRNTDRCKIFRKDR